MITRRLLLTAGGAAATLPALAAPALAKFRVAPHLEPQYVDVWEGIEAQSIYVMPRSFYLYWVEAPGKALRYGVGVGKAGLEFQGAAIIERKAKWPWWRPTRNMIRRDPGKYKKYAGGVPGGPKNPLGARALYLYQNGVDTYYRIHGTTQPESIGHAQSNGCIRMINEHVSDLYERVPIGTTVTVL
ncbi:MAG: L,D-transpeptidase [Pseudomonadota bacterium]